jgi:MYXO-CTERM domain-containing protein
LGEFSSNATDTLAMQEFAFNAAGVHAVDLVILSNHAPALRDYAAVYEVAFVPGPGATAVLGLAGLAIVRRRQR